MSFASDATGSSTTFTKRSAVESEVALEEHFSGRLPAFCKRDRDASCDVLAAGLQKQLEALLAEKVELSLK